MTTLQEDTIVAIITPVGTGAIAVLRLSGPDAIHVSDSFFRGRHSIASSATHTAHFGSILDGDGKVLDDIVATLFRAPTSYTGEDVVELSCHGSPFIAERLLGLCMEAGARLARPGEFTKRAFLNGRMDLTQAEAVADLIRSGSELSHRASIAQVRGSVSSRIKELITQVLDLTSLMELELDFSEEGIQLVERSAVIERIDQVLSDILLLLNSFKEGRIALEGVKIVLAGEPNVGKSSLLNALLQVDRAIVTHVSGTTRDALEERLSIDGLLFRIVDTAGIRKTADIIEIEGIKRTKTHLETADLVLVVIDATVIEGANDIERLKKRLIPEVLQSSQKALILVNKIDVAPQLSVTMIEKAFEDREVLKISAKAGKGLEYLRKRLREITIESELLAIDGSVVITNNRHVECLSKANKALELARGALFSGRSNEYVALDLRRSLDYLGEIVGSVTTEDVLNNIFANFCIGK